MFLYENQLKVENWNDIVRLTSQGVIPYVTSAMVHFQKSAIDEGVINEILDSILIFPARIVPPKYDDIFQVIQFGKRFDFSFSHWQVTVHCNENRDLESPSLNKKNSDQGFAKSQESIMFLMTLQSGDPQMCIFNKEYKQNGQYSRVVKSSLHVNSGSIYIQSVDGMVFRLCVPSANYSITLAQFIRDGEIELIDIFVVAIGAM